MMRWWLLAGVEVYNIGLCFSVESSGVTQQRRCGRNVQCLGPDKGEVSHIHVSSWNFIQLYFLRDCAGDRATAWHCSNVHTCWKPYKALRCRLPFISIFSLVLFAIDSFPLKVKDYVCPFLDFWACVSVFPIYFILHNQTVIQLISCILQRYSCGPN